MRGEHCPHCGEKQFLTGSSPHARGAPPIVLLVHNTGGIIPACAGSTRCKPRCRCCARDHPRMRGEHLKDLHTSGKVEGSSPHARGALAHRALVRGEFGIIPACAGSTTSPWRRRGGSRDHPRMRGEHSPVSTVTEFAEGSSPHARGALPHAARPAARVGIIPACAGSTRDGVRGVCGERDHPRMRGEHPTEQVFVREEMGSSPHARGAPGVAASTSFAGGIIPACAGSTWTCGL